VRLPAKSQNLNAYAERFVLSIKSEYLSRMVFFGEAPLRRAIEEYVAHYHEERAHQGIGNERIERGAMGRGSVECGEQLGSILKHYYRAA